MKPVIFHCDANNFYASCECLLRPELKNVPMAVAGDPKDRAGIVLAKNQLAKMAGVQTTDTLWQARRKCPDIVFVPPTHSLYSDISHKINEIYHEYTDYLEPASIDESYLDMTGAAEYFHTTPALLADSIRKRVREEIGLTISIGVSFCKFFAKMGSDYKKPDATTLITEENFRSLLWPLPVSDLLFAGRATVEQLNRKNIFLIGDLASMERDKMVQLLGKGGGQLWDAANGLDKDPVRLFGQKEEIKSISRGMTFRRDLVTEEEIHCGLSFLSDEVATQLRRHELKGAVIQLHLKDTGLKTISRQVSLPHYTCLKKEILDNAMQLVRTNWNIGKAAPVRALTVGVTHLVPQDMITEQLSLFDMADAARPGEKREKLEKLEAAVDKLRLRHGRDIVAQGIQQNEEIGVGNARERHKQ